MNEDLRLLLSRSDKLFSISARCRRSSASATGSRSKRSPTAWTSKGSGPPQAAESGRAERGEVVLRYCGGIAKDMTFQTLVDVVEGVDALQGELPIRLEVYTMPMWRRRFEEAVTGVRGTTFRRPCSATVFLRCWLTPTSWCSPTTSTRLPPLRRPFGTQQAAGVPRLGRRAPGRRATGGERHRLRLSHDLGCCVTDRDPDKIAEAIGVCTDTEYRDDWPRRRRPGRLRSSTWPDLKAFRSDPPGDSMRIRREDPNRQLLLARQQGKGR